jgi:seryl-tRNA synthetase
MRYEARKDYNDLMRGGVSPAEFSKIASAYEKRLETIRNIEEYEKQITYVEKDVQEALEERRTQLASELDVAKNMRSSAQKIIESLKSTWEQWDDEMNEVRDLVEQGYLTQEQAHEYWMKNRPGEADRGQASVATSRMEFLNAISGGTQEPGARRDEERNNLLRELVRLWKEDHGTSGGLS